MSSTPPPESARPDLPYINGFNCSIQSHKPPPPFGHSYENKGRSFLPFKQIQRLTQVELVLKYPPLETHDPSCPKKADLTVVDTMRTGLDAGPQILLCTVDLHTSGDSSNSGSSAQQFRAVAKVYDPLYYLSYDDDWRGDTDVATMADMQYSCEAGAYEHLETHKQTGGFAPEYYGSWTFTLPFQRAGETLMRPVRLILIEYLPGTSLRELTPSDCSAEHRLEIMARLLDGIVKQHHIAFENRDVAPRNVILVPGLRADDQADHMPRVVLIDYDISWIYELTKYKLYPYRRPLPLNPIDRFRNGPFWDFEGWIPIEWYSDLTLWQKWLASRFGGKETKKLYTSTSLKEDA